MNKLEEHKCKVRVWHGFNSHECGKKAKVEENGKYYCGIHNPEKGRVREEKNKKEFEKDMARRKYDSYAIIYCKRLGLTLEQLEQDANCTKDDGGKYGKL